MQDIQPLTFIRTDKDYAYEILVNFVYIARRNAKWQ